MILLEYYNFLNIFSKYNFNILISYCYCNYKIKLINNKYPENLDFILFYKFLLKELKKY